MGQFTVFSQLYIYIYIYIYICTSRDTPYATTSPSHHARRQVILGGIVGATLLSIAIASQVVSTDRRDEARTDLCTAVRDGTCGENLVEMVLFFNSYKL